MATPSIVTATLEHVAHIASNARQPDVEELWASGLSNPTRAMENGIRFSDNALTGMIDGEPVCMWGVVQESLIGNVGVPWMIGTDKLDLHAHLFLRRCKSQLLELLSRYDMLFNYVDARNTRAIRWLKWMGFTVEKEPEPYGYYRMPFHKFTMEVRKCVSP